MHYAQLRGFCHVEKAFSLPLRRGANKKCKFCSVRTPHVPLSGELCEALSKFLPRSAVWSFGVILIYFLFGFGGVKIRLGIVNKPLDVAAVLDNNEQRRRDGDKNALIAKLQKRS